MKNGLGEEVWRRPRGRDGRLLELPTLQMDNSSNISKVPLQAGWDRLDQGVSLLQGYTSRVRLSPFALAGRSRHEY